MKKLLTQTKPNNPKTQMLAETDTKNQTKALI